MVEKGKVATKTKKICGIAVGLRGLSCLAVTYFSIVSLSFLSFCCLVQEKGKKELGSATTLYGSIFGKKKKEGEEEVRV
jgi:hypothetical protein